MKQMKFFLVAVMAVVMGLSVTSCLNGEESTQVNGQPIIAKVKENFLNLTLVTLDGSTLIQAKNVVEGTTNWMRDDFVFGNFSYDRAVDIENNTIHATINVIEKISGNRVDGIEKVWDAEDNSSYASNRGVISITDVVPSMLDNNNLLIPIIYFCHEKIASHTFSLVYYTDVEELKNDRKELKVYLRHNSTEEQDKEGYKNGSYRVFDLSDALEQYKEKNDNQYPIKITIVAETNSSSNKVPEGVTEYSIEYKHNDKN